MINLDSLTLKALIGEIGEVLSSGRVQKVQQPSRKELLLNIRAQGKNHKLYISIDPKYPHLSVITPQGESFRQVEIPQKPPMFCMLLRKHMEGAKIKEIRQPNFERIFEIYFDSYGELGEKVPLVLSIELMGKHSNIILYNYDTNVILGCAHNVSSEKSREREVAGGLPYIYPPKQNKTDLLAISAEEFYSMAKALYEPMNSWLNSKFYNISLALADEICKITGIPVEKDTVIAIEREKITGLYELVRNTLALKGLNPSISADNKYYSIIAADKSIKWNQQASVNEMLDAYFGYHVYQDRLERLRTGLLSVVKKELKKNKTKITQHLKAVNSDEKSEIYRQTGDVIMANLYKIKPGFEQIEVENPYNNNELEVIKLDPSLSANANAQKYYKLYNKAKNAARISKEIIEKLESEKNYLEGLKLSMEQSVAIEELVQIQEELASENLIKSHVKDNKKAKKEKIEVSYEEINGFKVYIGKNNKQNDFIISKLAGLNDIWFHAQNMPGSHILIKLSQDKEIVDDETLYKAAKLAVYYSQARNSTKVPVIYTLRRFLKKPPGARLGYVTHSNEKTIFVE